MGSLAYRMTKNNLAELHLRGVVAGVADQGEGGGVATGPAERWGDWKLTGNCRDSGFKVDCVLKM